MDKNLLVVLILIPVLLIGGDWHLHAKKRKQEISKLKSQLDKTNKDISEANDAKQRIPEEQEALKKVKRNFQIVRRIFPTADEAESLVKQTIPVADKWVQFTELRPVINSDKQMSVLPPNASEKVPVPYKEVAMQMTLKASFAKLGRYLQEIENMRIMDANKMVDVSALEIKTDPQTGHLAVEMEVKTYSFPGT